MRAGACTVQQTLTSEAASVLKHSLGLARRRGHAQVTPLHVAATLLSSRVSLLRRACLKSHPHSTSHPLQCRALELCFNVALNRLPTTPGPLLHTTHPSLSNALIAALKRAQAHQRRGCIEQQQQQPLLAIKVELEQLIISILDDPSVSRVMREAGFSSTCVKNNLEDSSFVSSSPSSSSLFYTTTSNVGVQLSSSSCLETTHRSEIPSSFWQNPLFFPAQKINTHFVDSSGESAKEDLKLVLEVLLRTKKKRNTVIVGDCLSTTGNLVSQLMEKVERGDVPEELKSAHFVKFGVSSLSMRFMKRDDVEMKVADLRRRVGTVVSLGGAIIYAGDLKWVVEEDVRCHESYNPADHMIAEIGRLISDFSSMINSKVWLIGIANYQTYMRCQMKTPSLELQWALQPVAVPSGGLGLSLHASSAVDSRTTLSHNNISELLETKPFAGTPKEEQDKLVCCGECTSNYEKEASGVLKSSSSSSLITAKDEKETQIKDPNTTLPYWMQQFRPADNHHTNDVLLDLRRKWNRLCQSLHHHARQNGSSTYARSQPWWTSSALQFNSNINSPSHFESASKPSSNYNSLSQFTSTNQGRSSDSLERTESKDVKITLALGNSHFSESANEMREKMGREELSQALLANLPCHSDSIPSIVRALFDDQKLNSKRGTWLLIRGCDWVAKRRLALTMADSVLGSVDRLVEIDSKRSSGQSCERTLVEALRKDSNRVILIEDLDYAEPNFVKVLARGYEVGKLMEDPSGREVSLRKAIIILSVGIISSTTKTGEDENRGASVIQMKLVSEETRDCCKRKADWDWDSARNKSKYPKTGDEGDLSVSRQSSFSTLDLNVSAEGDDSDSDLTQEAPAATRHEFVESIKNSFVMDRNPSRSDRIGAMFRSKIEAAAAEAWGDEFEIEAEVVGELVKASAYFLDSFFEKWLKDVFQTSCQTVKNGGKGGIVLRLCLGGKEENVSGFGFLGSSSLPGRIQVVM